MSEPVMEKHCLVCGLNCHDLQLICEAHYEVGQNNLTDEEQEKYSRLARSNGIMNYYTSIDTKSGICALHLGLEGRIKCDPVYGLPMSQPIQDENAVTFLEKLHAISLERETHKFEEPLPEYMSQGPDGYQCLNCNLCTNRANTHGIETAPVCMNHLHLVPFTVQTTVCYLRERDYIGKILFLLKISWCRMTTGYWMSANTREEAGELLSEPRFPWFPENYQSIIDEYESVQKYYHARCDALVKENPGAWKAVHEHATKCIEEAHNISLESARDCYERVIERLEQQQIQ